MTTPSLPDILVRCEDCDEESNCHPPEMVAWSAKRGRWLCSECYFDDGIYDAEKDKYINETPLVWAAYALDSHEDMRRRMIAAMTAKRIGV